MAKPPDGRKTLRNILTLIHKDVEYIKVHKTPMLATETALQLTRYASTLADIIEETKKAKDRLKKENEKLTTQELLAKYQQLQTKGPIQK